MAPTGPEARVPAASEAARELMAAKAEQETFHDRASTWVSTTKMPLRDENGQIIGTFGISRDITAQIQAEKAPASRPGTIR